MTIFKQIIAGEIPCYKIWEDEHFLCFLDIAPKSKGHALVIPKEEYEDITDIPDFLLKDLIVKVKKTAALLMTTLGADGCNIVQNTKPAAGQEVLHIHFHIIPRYKGDDVSWFKSTYSEKNFKDVLELIHKESITNF